MDDIKQLLGNRIKNLRKKQGITQLKLAELVDIDQRSMSHIECGDVFPSRVLSKIANALHVSLCELFDFEYLKVTPKMMSEYIKSNIDNLPENDLLLIYRLVKLLR